VSVRHWWEWNYYHFYFDVLGKLPALDAAGVPSDAPLVLGRYVDEMPWARQLIGRGALAERNWVVQRADYFEAGAVTYCRSRRTYRERAEYLVKALDAPAPPDGPGQRIFLNRSAGGIRQLSNLDAVRECLLGWKFDELDAAKLSIAEQMAMFADIRYLVAVHGAGLTNVIYRQGHPMDVVEIFGGNYNSFDFRNLSRELGYGWYGVEGTLAPGDPQLANIAIDVAALDRILASVLP
jgi:capsular polysaccharide biosynthesis protein